MKQKPIKLPRGAATAIEDAFYIAMGVLERQDLAKLRTPAAWPKTWAKMERARTELRRAGIIHR